MTADTDRNMTPSRDRGMTLIELVIVLAVFALMATLSLQALSGTLRSRDHLVAQEQQTGDITLALSLLRADLRAAVPLLFHDPGGASHSAFRISPEGRGFGLSVSGRRDLPGNARLAGLGRVDWSFDPGSGELRRASWPVLIPANRAVRGPEVVLARGITGLNIRRLAPNLRWINGADPAAGGSQSTLPRAIEVTLTSDRFQRISTLVSYP